MQFQSSPAPKDGRYSIPASQWNELNVFQSSPAPKDGRYGSRSRGAGACMRFNPRPPRRTGATQFAEKMPHIKGVSILARPEGRALPPGNMISLREIEEVSILARPEGRALHDHGSSDACRNAVSILARPEGRALHSLLPYCDEVKIVSILARPEGRALRHSWPISRARIRRFQSSPAPKDGRYNGHRQGNQGISCFNPRPPRRTGATFFPFSFSICRRVSILARPEGRALRPRARRFHMARQVSILARPEGRALRLLPCCVSSIERVSILARPEGRALLRPERLGSLPDMFQSSPAPKDGRYHSL